METAKLEQKIITLESNFQTHQQDFKEHVKEFRDHVKERLVHDQEVAVTLQKIQDTTQNTLNQTTKTNGYVARHEVSLLEAVPKIAILMTDLTDRETDKKDVFKKWTERVVWIGLLLGLYLLQVTHIINIPK